MQHTWRALLKERIKEKFVHTSQEWFDIFLSTAGNLDLTIVSHQFSRLPFTQRRELVQELLSQLDISFGTGMLSLYTPQEAETLELTPSVLPEEPPVYTWLDLANLAANLDKTQPVSRRAPQKPRTITFYSFKGGVGRTTALIHIATILAQRGRKVVAVDLDLEAPGLSSAFNLVSSPQHGIVDYFYERGYMPKGIEPTILVTEIFGEVRIPEASGSLFIVPAGKLNLDYITKVDDLRAGVVTHTGEDLWTTFFNEINQHLHPDIILVDSRTGINEWGAFSLLRAADKAIVFLYPNEQNRQGIDLLLDALAGTMELKLVFSPVPFGTAGQLVTQKYWSMLQEHQKRLVIRDSEDDDSSPSEPIIIPYLTELALASVFPVFEALPHYTNIANAIDEETTALGLEQALSNAQQRWKILESLRFPEEDEIAAGKHLPNFFQRTVYFDKFLDKATCLIQGRKGTGKTTLYTLFIKHFEIAQNYALGRMDRVRCISGHGNFQENGLTKEDLRYFDQKIKEAREKNKERSWIDFWCAYLLLRLYQEDILQEYADDPDFQPPNAFISAFPKATNTWSNEQKDHFSFLFCREDYVISVKKWLSYINKRLQQKEQAFWFLFDNLDTDLESPFDQVALGGLFILARTFDYDHLNLAALRFKIFLRENTWKRLKFPNKSFFNGRNISLQWTRVDFLRLALRLAQQSSTDFKKLVDDSPSRIRDIDLADETDVDEALQLLWGFRRDASGGSERVSQWLFHRLTDFSSAFYPGSLYILFRAARLAELGFKDDMSPPPEDRLLRRISLLSGLAEVSHYRCKELKEEYPDLKAFFNALDGHPVVISPKELNELWNVTVQGSAKEFSDFQYFVDFLKDIGLSRAFDQQYRFADIYVFGLRLSGITRKFDES